MIEYAYQLIDAGNLDVAYGWLGGVTGGKVTESYRGDYRSSCELDLDGAEVALGRAVRVWEVSVADSGEETSRRPIGTFFPDPGDMDLSHGRLTGTVSLYSAMKRLGTDLRKGDATFPKGAAMVDKFCSMVASSGGTPHVQSGFGAGRKFGSNRLWEHGKSALSACHDIADALTGWVDVDEWGRVTLSPYVVPAKRADSFSLTSRDVEVSVGMSSPDVVNRVIAHHEVDKRLYGAEAHVADSHPWAFSKIKRWETEEASVPTLAENADVQKELDALVKRRLAELSDVRKTYSATALSEAAPKPGLVGRFLYQDIEGGVQVNDRVLVSERETDLSGSGMSQLTLEVL